MLAVERILRFEVAATRSPTLNLVDATAETATVAVFVTDPPVPVQESVNVASLMRATDTAPLVAPLVVKFVPLQVVALVEDQVTTVSCPLVTEAGTADNIAVGAMTGVGVGAGAGVTVLAPLRGTMA